MDLREKKTKRSIRAAFLQLRAQKPLERITVKELAELAEISKATFYLHYKDIYDLSAHLERAVIREVLGRIPHPTAFLSDPKLFVTELVGAIQTCQQEIDILFSGSRQSVLPESLERALREHICATAPKLRDNEDFHVLLTYQVQGGYYAYMKNRRQYRKGDESFIALLAEQSQSGVASFLEALRAAGEGDGLPAAEESGALAPLPAETP